MSPVKAMIMAESTSSRPRRVPKSQFNVPEHIRKHSMYKADAKDLIIVEQRNFGKERLNQLLDPFYDYSTLIDRVPEDHLPLKIKQQMKKTKEMNIHRTIQTESAMKMTSEWTMPRMMVKAQVEKKRKRQAELDRIRQEEEARKLMEDSSSSSSKTSLA